MLDHSAAITAVHLEQMMVEIRYFVEHPRIQQRRWVEKGQTWLPLLQQARAHLLAIASSTQASATPAPESGLEVRPRDTTTWGYSWNGGPLVGSYPSFALALEAALGDRVAEKRG